ncbi:unnamed protein product [Leptidea sinapis]|uniref:Uncharacterized protein n=1 Tax=Leptidea sinapis TaxID=189913 RepID=A0A5E4PS14_9NEOP|nr:unnamed protein product [Leptidea sinapis]
MKWNAFCSGFCRDIDEPSVLKEFRSGDNSGAIYKQAYSRIKIIQFSIGQYLYQVIEQKIKSCIESKQSYNHNTQKALVLFFSTRKTRQSAYPGHMLGYFRFESSVHSDGQEDPGMN